MLNLYRFKLSVPRSFFAGLLTVVGSALSAQPVIHSLSPASGPAGTTVTINGNNFNASKDSNIVYLGGVKAPVLTATPTTLTLSSPRSATFDPLSVLNTSTGQIGYSYGAFVPTFNGGATNQTTINTMQTPPLNLGTYVYPYQTVAADLDGDGRPDLVVNDGLSVQVFRNTTTPGTFNSTSFASPQAYPADGYSWNVVLRDLNGDGKLDLLCAASQNNFKVHIYMNKSTPGTISFTGGQTFPFGGGVIDAADIDGDGKLDMLTAFGGGVAVWLNTTPLGGAASFANPVPFGLAGNVAAMAVSDIDGDGKPDIVTANGTNNTLTVLRNTARVGVINDSSLAPYLLINMRRPANYIAIGDLDADNKPDIVVATDSGVAILKNLATPGTITTASFAPEIDFPTGTLIGGVTLGDLDGDGKPEIVTPNFVGFGKGFASVLKNNTTPGSITTASFAAKSNCYANTWANGANIVDLDGDGKPELVITGGSADETGAVSIVQPVINTQPPAIGSVSPDSAGAGNTVTIHGRYFSAASTVTLGGIPVTTFTVWSDTLITAQVANGGTGSVSVTTSLGTGTLAGFHYIARPAITGFTPATAGRGDTVVISGSQLTDADTLSFGGIAPTWFSVVSDNAIKAVIGGTGASGNVVVKTPFGVDTVAGFTYLSYPLLTSFTPAGGKTGDTISIHGVYLSTANSITFGGAPATGLMIVSDTVAKAIVGAGASGKIGVTTPTGSATIDGFTYIYPAPTITGFSPANGPVGTTVTITGSGFDPVPANNIVYFGGAKAIVSAGNSTSLTVTAPVGATYQPLTVTTHRKTAYAEGPFTLTFSGGGSLNSTSFAAPVTVGQGYATTMLDVDGDGKLDIATFFNQNLAFIRNTGTNGSLVFGAPTPTPSPTGINPQTLAYFDADGDGRLDLLMGYSDGRPIMVYPNNSSKGNIVVGSGQSWVGTALDQVFVAPGDFNGDGQPDAATVSNYGRAMTVMTNTSLNSTLGFVGSSWSGPYLPNQTVVSDLDGDGKPDVIVDGHYSSQIGIYRNTTTTTTAAFAAVQYITVSPGTNYLQAVDVDGDGKPDLVVSTGSTALYVYLNTSSAGTISFAAPVSLPLGGNPGYLAIGDLDGDGHPDIAAPQSNINTLTLFHNSSTPGTISFADTADITTGASAGMIAIGDVNGDGRPDIVLNTGYNQAVYLNQINIANLPVITTVSPDTAAQNGTVTLTGSHFTGATSVTFGGVPAASYTVVSDNTLTAVLGQGGSGTLSVTTAGGTATKDSFFYVYPAPAVTAFTPATAATGTTITITGSHFTGVTAVTFGGIPAASFSVMNDGTITAVVGAAVSGSVAVADSSGKDSLGGFTYIPPPPTVTGFTPASAGPGTTVTITGTGFTNATAVSFNGTPATSFTVVSPTTITAVVGNGSTGSIVVTNAEGSASLGGFTYNKPTPTITSFTPAKAPPGSVITIVGTNLNTATAVTIGGIPVTSFTASADTIQAVLAPSDSGYIYVTTPYGTVGSSTSFWLITPIATLTSFSPTTATAGTTVTILGTHLTNATGVSFGGTAASSFYVYSDNEIIAVVGSGASGNLVVSTPNGPDTLTGFVYDGPPPTLTGVYPLNGKQGAQIYLSGTSLKTATSVTLGGVPATFSVVSDYNLLVTVGNGASGNVVVTTPTGTASLSGFVFIPPTPVLTSFSPASGAGGTLITLHGKYLTGTSWVQIGQWYALNVQVQSDSVVTAVINNNGSSGTVIVTTPGGTASLGGFTWLSPGTPAITGISPASGGPGTVVTITGTNLFNVTSATFGGVAANSLTVVSPNTVTAVVGQGATGTVTVTAPGYGSATFSGFTYSTDSTPVTPPPVQPLMLYSFSPSHAKQGQTVTLRGASLDSATSVTFGGVSAQSFTILNDSTITAIVGTGASGKIFVRSPRTGIDSLFGFVFDTTATTPPPQDSIPVTPPPTDTIPSTPPPGDSVGTTPPDTTATPPPSFQLKSFTGMPIANQAFLNWSVLHEQRIASYIIQYSADTIHFSPIAAIAAQEKDSGNYVFTDTTQRSGLNFYRLAIINRSLDTTYSPIVAIQLAGVPATISLYPNPSAGGYFYVNTPSILTPSKFEVVDMSGNVIQLVPVNTGATQVKITVTSEMRGVYKIVWSNGSQWSYQTVLILR